MQRENDTALLTRILESTREGVGEVLLAEEEETKEASAAGKVRSNIKSTASALLLYNLFQSISCSNLPFSFCLSCVGTLNLWFWSHAKKKQKSQNTAVKKGVL